MKKLSIGFFYSRVCAFFGPATGASLRIVLLHSDSTATTTSSDTTTRAARRIKDTMNNRWQPNG